MIHNPMVIKSGIKLPSIDNPGSAADLLTGKQLIDQAGNPLTGTMPEVEQATPNITVNSNGLITASSTQSGGKVAAGTKNATKQLTTQGAQTITPGTSNKTISSGRYLTGVQTIKGDANLVAGNIKSGVSIFGVAGSYAGPEVVTDRLTLAPYELGWRSDTQDFSVQLTNIPSEILWVDITIASMAAIERASYNSSIEYIVSLHGNPSLNNNYVGLFGITAYGGGSIHLSTSGSYCYFLANTGTSKVLTFYGNNKIYHAVNTVYTTINLRVIYKK